MKKTILLTGLFFGSILYPALSISRNTFNEPKGDRAIVFSEGPKDTFTLPGENTISLMHDYVSPTMATVYENNVQNLQISGSSISNTGISLQQSDIFTLYSQAYGLLSQAKRVSSSGNFLTAIEIFYGINSGSMRYYFLPVCLQTSTGPPLPGTYTYTVTAASSPSGSNQLYVYNASTGSISTTTLLQLSADTTTYAQQIGIVHSCGASPTFVETTNLSSPSADTKYVVFPFQEIFHMMETNGVTGLTMYNVAMPVPIVGGNSNSIRHDLLLTPSSSPGGPINNPCDDDLAHMVPPDYANLTYTVTNN